MNKITQKKLTAEELLTLIIQVLLHGRNFVFLTFAMNFIAEITGNKPRRGQVQRIIGNTPGMIRINLCEAEKHRVQTDKDKKIKKEVLDFEIQNNLSLFEEGEHPMIERGTDGKKDSIFNNNRGSALFLPSEEFYKSAEFEKYFYKNKDGTYSVNIKNRHKYYNPKMTPIALSHFYHLLKKYEDKNAKFVIEGEIDIENSSDEVKELWEEIRSAFFMHTYTIRESINNVNISLKERFALIPLQKKASEEHYLYNKYLEYVKKIHKTDLETQNKCNLTYMAIKSWLKNTLVKHFINRFYKKNSSLSYHDRKGMSKVQAAKDLLVYLYQQKEFKWVLYDNNIPYDTLELITEAMTIDMESVLNLIVNVLFDKDQNNKYEYKKNEWELKPEYRIKLSGEKMSFINRKNDVLECVTDQIKTSPIAEINPISVKEQQTQLHQIYTCIIRYVRHFCGYNPDPTLYEIRMKDVSKKALHKLRQCTYKIYESKVLKGNIGICLWNDGNYFIKKEDIKEENNVKINFSNAEDFNVFCKQLNTELVN